MVHVYMYIIFILDEPTHVSSMTMYKDGYVDILDCRRGLSDIKYSLKPRPDVPSYKYNHPRTPAQLKQDVIKSDRVSYAIEQVDSIEPRSACVGSCAVENEFK